MINQVDLLVKVTNFDKSSQFIKLKKGVNLIDFYNGLVPKPYYCKIYTVDGNFSIVEQVGFISKDAINIQGVKYPIIDKRIEYLINRVLRYELLRQIHDFPTIVNKFSSENFVHLYGLNIDLIEDRVLDETVPLLDRKKTAIEVYKSALEHINNNLNQLKD